ncbi:MAG: MORN repeat-containing protein, partial [Bacteroidia bacterium]
AMKMKNYQAAQQHWLEALAIHPKNKYIKQQISVCEQEIQKELQKDMAKQIPSSAPTKKEEVIKSAEPLPIAATPAPTNNKVYGRISGLKDSEGQLFDYEGEIVANQPNGKGKLTYKNGSICEGIMQNARLNGSCTCTFSNGDRYIGTVKNDRREGRGIYFYTKLGSRYIGEWLNDRQHGKGMWYYENGDKYEAEFVNGHPKGTIKYSYHTGDVVLGKWENGRFTKL